ncbi:8-oxo-dGTP diphosphatase MutT [Vibrio sp. RC27]
MKRVHIVAAIILNPDKSQIFITKRPDHVHKGGFWEFPGGKVEVNESVEQAVVRELNEEIGIEVTRQHLFHQFDYDYPDKSLHFDFICVTEFVNEPYGREGQQGQWVSVSTLADFEFPEANRPIVEQVINQFSV